PTVLQPCRVLHGDDPRTSEPARLTSKEAPSEQLTKKSPALSGARSQSPMTETLIYPESTRGPNSIAASDLLHAAIISVNRDRPTASMEREERKEVPNVD